jgi:isopenicillin-N N-acyltransferase-like protein
MHKILFLLACGAVVAQIEHHSCHSQTFYFGPQNKLPIVDAAAQSQLVAQVANGKLFKVSLPATNSSFWVTHLYGAPYEQGFAQGQLHKTRVAAFLQNSWQYLEQQVAMAIPEWMPAWLAAEVALVGLEAALDLTELVTRAYTGQYFRDELRGICDGAGLSHDPNFNCYSTAIRLHMLAGLTQGHCSLFGSWGAASLNNHTLQLRALDWNMQGPFRNFAAVTVYHGGPGNNTFASVGFVAMIGGLTGVSSAGLGISEIGVSYPGTDGVYGTQSRIGYPFIFLLRDILQFDQTVDDATNRMANAKRTCDLILAVGDGNEALVRSYLYSASRLYVEDDRNGRPLNNTWHFPLPQMVYHGMDYNCPSYTGVLGTQLRKHHGVLTPELAIRDVISVVASGSNHVAIYDLTAMKMWVSFASPLNDPSPLQDAYDRQFAAFDLATLFAI